MCGRNLLTGGDRSSVKQYCYVSKIARFEIAIIRLLAEFQAIKDLSSMQSSDQVKLSWFEILIPVANGSTGLMKVTTPWNGTAHTRMGQPVRVRVVHTHIWASRMRVSKILIWEGTSTYLCALRSCYSYS